MKGSDLAGLANHRIAVLWFHVMMLVLVALLAIGCVGAGKPAALLATSAPSAPVTQPSTPNYALLQEKRLLSFEWPDLIRVGDADIVRLTLETDTHGQITPSAEVSGRQFLGRGISIPNLYDTDNIIAEARLDMAGLQVSPDGAVRQTMLPGQTLVFYWSVSPDQAGLYRGTLWVYLDLIPKNGGEMDRRTLIAHRIDIQSTTVLGLPATTARWVSAGGAVFGSILVFPFLEKVLEELRKRLCKEK